MPDWEQLVADRLARSKLTPDVQREVVLEIAAHLRQRYDELVAAGSADAEGETLAQVSDWNTLARNIRRAKEDPMNVVQRVMIPGVVATIAAQAALQLFVYFLIAPQPCGADASCIMVSADGPAYLPWLLTLLPVGAVAALLARWMGARPIQRVIAAVCPALYLAAETVVMGLLEGTFFWRIPIYWVLLPAIASAIGAMPFLGLPRGSDRDPARADHVCSYGLR
jgi:hypothetical protein